MTVYVDASVVLSRLLNQEPTIRRVGLLECRVHQ